MHFKSSRNSWTNNRKENETILIKIRRPERIKMRLCQLVRQLRTRAEAAEEALVLIGHRRWMIMVSWWTFICINKLLRGCNTFLGRSKSKNRCWLMSRARNKNYWHWSFKTKTPRMTCSRWEKKIRNLKTKVTSASAAPIFHKHNQWSSTNLLRQWNSWKVSFQKSKSWIRRRNPRGLDHSKTKIFLINRNHPSFPKIPTRKMRVTSWIISK